MPNPLFVRETEYELYVRAARDYARTRRRERRARILRKLTGRRSGTVARSESGRRLTTSKWVNH